MMQILLTSFRPWLSHQGSNASDDLLIQLQESEDIPPHWHFLRQLPVDTVRASERVITQIEQLQPDVILCCGMAESRYLLTVESNATNSHERYHTKIPLLELVAQLQRTRISHDAGKFVCEGLYFQVLRYLHQYLPQSQALFIHVPVLTLSNVPVLLADITQIIQMQTNPEQANSLPVTR